jgi:hypothetical protein
MAFSRSASARSSPKTSSSIFRPVFLMMRGGSKALLPPGSASRHLRSEARHVSAVVAWVRPLAGRLEVMSQS